jgi:hypothetical protein
MARSNRSQDSVHFSSSPFLPLLIFWEYKCNNVTFCGFNYLLYIWKLFKNMVERERERVEKRFGEDPNSKTSNFPWVEILEI